MEKPIFEAPGGMYTELGEILIPDISMADAACLGKWGGCGNGPKEIIREGRKCFITS